VVADVFARLWERRETWRPCTAAEVYVVSAVRNHALNVARNARGRGAHLTRFGAAAALGDPPPGIAQSPFAAPGDALDDRERGVAVRRAMAALPKGRREVVLLRANGLAWAEVAERLGVSVAAAQMQHGRAVRALGALVGDAQR